MHEVDEPVLFGGLVLRGQVSLAGSIRVWPMLDHEPPERLKQDILGDQARQPGNRADREQHKKPVRADHAAKFRAERPGGDEAQVNSWQPGSDARHRAELALAVRSEAAPR